MIRSYGQRPYDTFFIVVLLYDSPAGLVLYWTLNNVFSLVPIPLAPAGRQKVDLKGDLWKAVVDATRQDEYFGETKIVR